MSDFMALRKDFPILSRTFHGQRLVYMDNAATSQKPSQVIQSIVDYYEGYNSNVHRDERPLPNLHALPEESRSGNS